MKSIKQTEGQAEKNPKLNEALKELGLLPEGYQLSVRLHGKSRDKKRTAAFERNWSPESDSISIAFQPISEVLKPEVAIEHIAQTASVSPPNHATQAGPCKTNPLIDLIRALDRAESRPGYEFVALKWFRDTALLEEGMKWVGDYSARQTILREAIDKRLILTSKMPNPKSPQFPVTAIRLNRLMPEVRTALGNYDAGASDSDFEPIPIRGELLSQTVIRDRR